MVGLDVLALIVSLVALLVAILQMVQQYAASSAVRAKVNAAAVGSWSQKTKYRWSFWEWKLRIQYARAEFDCNDVLSSLMKQEMTFKRLVNQVPDIRTANSICFAEGPAGTLIDGKPKLLVYRRGEENEMDIPLKSLPWRERRLMSIGQRLLERQYARPPSRRATWYNLMEDIGLDMEQLRVEDYLDAETIPSTLDAPATQIHLSDLIQFGILLHMRIVHVDEERGEVQMTGRHCNITTRHQEGVGQLSRYSGLPPRIQPSCRMAGAPQLQMCLRTASGIIQVGDAMASVEDWGYNSVDAVMREALRQTTQSDWDQKIISSVRDKIEGDSDSQWNGKWSRPMVHALPFVLSHCGCMSVANSFPGIFLQGWDQEQRRLACSTAIATIQSTMGIVQTPISAFDPMRHMQVFVTSDFNVASNYGCEYGGLRSWMSCNLSEFTYRISKCWNVQETTDSIPILARLYPLLRDGTLNMEWCTQYDENSMSWDTSALKNDRGKGWRMMTAPLLWLQITMLDTWIGRRADIIMSGEKTAEISVPTDVETARRAAIEAMSLPQTTGWKKSRMEFLLLYLQRLAEGVGGKAVSCMGKGREADGIQCTVGSSAWQGIPSGTAEDWATIDAVLTLRAFLLHLRLQYMNDSSVLLRLRRFNPVVNLA